MPVATHLVGRTTELAALDDLLATAEDGTARALEIAGPAGIGKSRLLAELAQRADMRGHVVLSGTGAELEQDLPFWLFVDALDEYVDALQPRGLERLDPRTAAELANVLPSMAHAAGGAAGAVHERHRTHRAMRDLLEHLAATKPLVLILDDFHWADPASTDLLVALLHRPPAAGVLVALAARPRQLPSRLASALDRAHRGGTLQRLELGALSADEARELVGPEAALLYEEAGGNPFYLEQLARVARPAAGPAQAPGAPEVLVGGVEVPPMVAAALTEDLRLLAPSARAVLDGAAVAGDPFEVDLAAAAARVGEPEALDALDVLVAMDFCRPTEVPRRFRFRHPILRRAVYEAAPSGWRIGAHERVAGALAARGAGVAARAHHVERSGRHGDEAAVALLQEAADDTRFRAPATAARWYEAALRLLPESAPPPRRVALLLPLAQSLAASGQFPQAHEALLACIAIAPAEAVAERTELAATCARVEHLLGLHEQAHERLVAALGELPGDVSPEGVSLLVELTMDVIHRMDYEAMAPWARRAVAAARELGDPLLLAVALAARARAAAVPGATAEATELRDAAAAAVDALSDEQLAQRLDAATYLGGTELYLHRFDDAGRHSGRALRVARETGQGNQFPVIIGAVGIVWLLQGRLREAAEPVEQAVEAARLTGNAQTIAWSLYARAKLALAAGDVALGLSAAQEAADLTADEEPNHHYVHAAYVLAEASVETGKPERAVELLEGSAGGSAMPRVALGFRSYFLELLVRARLAIGDQDGARRSAEAARVAADAVGLPLAAAWADRAAAAVALAAGDVTAAVARAEAAAQAMHAAGVPLEAGMADVVLARGLVQAGDPERARRLLEAAAATFEDHGALRYRDAAERELRALGHRVHRRSGGGAAGGTGVEALTRRELEVARLIVDRQTNRQIAEALFLSPKTVETHIRNIFTKLGADSRVEVARIVERADRLGEAAPPPA